MHKLTRTIMIRAVAKMAKVILSAPIASILILAISAVPVGAQTFRIAAFNYLAVLNAGQEVPPTPSNAIGVAFLTLNRETTDLCYSISFTVLDGLETAAHIHGPADPGDNAGVLFDISPSPPGLSPLGSPKTGCVGPLSKREREALMKGLFYIDIHSDVFPDGEIRGQVMPQYDFKGFPSPE